MVAAPSSPEPAPEIFRRPDGFVARNGTCCDSFPWLTVLARRDYCGSPPFGDCVVALARVVGAVGGDAGNLLIERNLAEQFSQHARVAYIAAGDFDRPYFLCFLVDPEVYHAPDLLFLAAIARIPLSLTVDLDAGSVNQQMQRAPRPPMRDVHGKALLATAECAKVGHLPVHADEPQQALDKASRLPHRHPEKGS